LKQLLVKRSVRSANCLRALARVFAIQRSELRTFKNGPTKPIRDFFRNQHLLPENSLEAHNLLIFLGRIVYLRLTCGVVLDEVFKLGYPVGRQFPKLHTTSPDRYGTQKEFVSYFEIRNVFKRHLTQIKIGH